MDDDTARASAINKVQPRRGFRTSLVLVGLLATIGLLAAACGGSKDPGVAGGGRTTTTVAPSGTSGSGSRCADGGLAVPVFAGAGASACFAGSSFSAGGPDSVAFS